jgi:glutathione S-transferase
MTITLFEFAPTRSARARWTLLELDLPFESIAGPETFKHAALESVHPLRRLPALLDDGRPLFESAAICTWLADAHPEKGLIAPAGTWERALHDQWVAFTLAELEANLWSTARNQFIYPEEKRVTQIFEQNAEEARRAAGVLDRHLEGRAWLVGERFSVTDIFVGYALNWARLKGLTTRLPNVESYCERLLSMPLCPYQRALTRPQS